MELEGADRRALRGLGHSLRPTVLIGREGISEAVVGGLEEALAANELVKVKVLDTCPGDRREVAVALAEKSGAELVQLLGRTALLFRRPEDHPRIALPSDSKRRG